MKYKFLLLLAFLVIFLPSFQCRCKCDDVLDNFDIKGVKLSHQIAPGTLSTENEVAFQNYNFLYFKYDVDYVFNKCQVGFKNMFSNEAMACDCEFNGYLGAKDESIQSLNIFTLNDFDQEHLANDTINDLFKATYDFRDTIELDEYITTYSTSLIPNEEVRLLLKKAPEFDKEFKVMCILTLSNGEVYEYESTGVKITN